MKYFPILQELFESDTIIFLLIGLAISLLLSFRTKENKKILIWLLISIAIYAVCEALSNIRTNYLLEIILLFLGTAAIGCLIGLIVRMIALKIKHN